MKVFTDTNYRESGAGDLVEYLDKEDGLRNRLGEQMSDEEIQAFIEQSEAYDFERQIIISPENGEQLSNQELSHHTRKVMSEFCTDRQTATYCYAIHRDTDHPHTQVAITGTKRDLWMDREDCKELRELATEQFHEQHRELTAKLSEQVEAELGVDLEAEQQLEGELEPGDGRSALERDNSTDRQATADGQEPAQSLGEKATGAPDYDIEPEMDERDEMDAATDPNVQRTDEIDQQMERQP